MTKNVLPLIFVVWIGLMVPAAFGQEGQPLSLRQAQEIAIQKHPKITTAELLALAAKQVTREARSAYFPTVTFNATAAGTLDENNTRIAAGGLNNPVIFDRNAEGINIGQLITDFGRTANLTASAKLRSRAEEENAVATRAQILLEVNAAYFDALQAQTVVAVARQTVATRQLTYDQVAQLATNKLKSGLDLSFAQVNLDEGRLLLANGENDLQASFATLSNLLGDREARSYQLQDEPMPAGGTNDPAQLVEMALRDRPDLIQGRFTIQAAEAFARAERDLHYPTISAVASGGLIPVHDTHLEDNYAAAGVNFSLPIFDGMLFSARESEARLRARAAAENVRDAENNVIRDVRIAVLNLNYSAQKLDLTAKLLASANEAFELAQARYNVGSSSIVELSQALLNKTEAEIGEAKARYEFHIRDSILKYQTGALQ